MRQQARRSCLMVLPVAIESMMGKKRFFMTLNLRSRYPSMPSAAPALPAPPTASAPEWPAVRCLRERSYDQYIVSFGRQGYGRDKTGIRVGAAEFRCISIKMRHRRIYIRHGGLFYVKATKGLNIFYMVFPCIKISNQRQIRTLILTRSAPVFYLAGRAFLVYNHRVIVL